MSELRGSLRTLGLVPFVQFLSQQGRTGRLKIWQAGLEGEIAFNYGRIVSVATGAERGESAIELFALTLVDGDFVYTDTPIDEARLELATEQDQLRDELQKLVERTRREAASVLSSVPRLLNPVPNGVDEELVLTRADIAVLLAVDGVHTTAELLRGPPTLRSLQTLTRLSDLGIIELEPTRPALVSEQTPHVAPDATALVSEQSPNVAPDAQTTVTRPYRRGRWVREGLQVVALTAVFALALRVVVQSVHVQGQSMLPGLHEGELLVVDRMAYFHDEGSVFGDILPFAAQGRMRYPLGGPRRGDVVVFDSPTEPGVELVKRIIGLPGENVRIEDGQVFIDETPLHEAYTAPTGLVTERYPQNAQFVHIPDDSYFVLGDNRVVSQDSRQGWLVGARNLVGRAWLAYWPPSDWGLVSHANVPVSQNVPTPEPSTATVAQLETPTTVATSVPAIVPTLTSVPETRAPDPRLLLSGPIRNQPEWPSDPTGTAWFDGQAYRLTSKQPMHFVAVAAPVSDVLTDVAVTAVFHKVGGPPGGGYGIIVRDQGPGPRDGTNQRGNYYLAEAGDRGEIGIWRRDDDHWVELVPWTPSDAVYVGGTSNQLVVRADGPQLVFTVNGRQVGAVADAALPNGRVGAFVGGDSNEIVLDEYTVELPPVGVTP